MHLLDLEAGQKLQLAHLQQLAQEHDWKSVPPSEMEQMKLCVVESRMQKLKGARSCTKGHLTDVRATSHRVQQEVSRRLVFFKLSHSLYGAVAALELPM